LTKKGKERYYDLFQTIVNSNDREALVKIAYELYEVHWLISGNRQIKHFLENIVVSRESRESILIFIVGKILDDPSEYTIAFLVYLMRKNYFQKLSYIMHVFKYYLSEEKNLLLVEVVSRYPIEATILNSYKHIIEKNTNHHVEFIYKFVPNMLGGFKLRWHAGEIDATLRKRLDKLKDLIMKRKDIVKC
jgi:ATP synthase F1 delta subunit